MSGVLFAIGLFGFLNNKKDIISFVISLEIIFLSINIVLVAISQFIGNPDGNAFVILILAACAGEVAVLLGIIILHYKNHGEISINSSSNLNEKLL